jgi:hypothetical protein
LLRGEFPDRQALGSIARSAQHARARWPSSKTSRNPSRQFHRIHDRALPSRMRATTRRRAQRKARMASIERTAYRRFPRLLTPHDLQRLFTPSAEDLDWVRANARTDDRQPALMVQFKCFQYLHHFIAVSEIPPEVVEHIAACMGLPAQQEITYPGAHRSLYRHHEAIREHLGVRAFSGPRARADAARIARDACRAVNTRIDVINILISELVRTGYERPTYSALLKIAEKALYAGVEARLSNVTRMRLTRSPRARGSSRSGGPAR